jgi:tetratricopeptide (TPR) repeat protein
MRLIPTTLVLTIIGSFQWAVAQPITPTPLEIALEVEGPLSLDIPSEGLTLAAAIAPGEVQENKKDPAYKTYKEGYNAILDERWDDALKKFGEVTAKYPKSDYVDDAEYWRAYALSHTDRKKGVDAYQRFMKKYPNSRYVDDVVADLGGLDPTVVVTSSDDSAHIVVSSSPRAHSYSYGTNLRISEAQIRKADAMTRKLNRELTRSFSPRPPRMPRMSLLTPSAVVWDMERETNLDPDTRVRLEALYAIGDTKEDETAFQTLKDVALDRGQNVRLRQAAIEVLSDFRKFDVMPVFLELAKKDTNERIQDAAIEFIGRASKDKNKSVDALVVLFNSMPGSRKEKLETVLFTIADVGNDKAIDFLSTVARTHENYELRSDAVYYLGTIGGEKSRKALYQILRSK